MSKINILYFLFDKWCASGSVVERRLAKAKAAGSNPVSRFLFLLLNPKFYKDFGVFIYSALDAPWVNSCSKYTDKYLRFSVLDLQS